MTLIHKTNKQTNKKQQQQKKTFQLSSKGREFGQPNKSHLLKAYNQHHA